MRDITKMVTDWASIDIRMDCNLRQFLSTNGYINANGALIKSASYIISADKTTIKAINGHTGIIDFKETDLTSVIQSCINKLPSSGGLIFIKKDTYILSSKISIVKDNIIINSDGATLKINSAATFCIEIGSQSSTTKQCSNISISNLTLDGNYPTINNSTGISISACENVLINNVTFQNCGERNWCSIWSETEYPKRNIVFSRCKFLNVPLTIGGGEHVIVDNCIFSGTLVSPNSTSNTIIDFSFGELNSSMIRDTWIKNCHFYQCKRNSNFTGSWGGIIVGFQRSEYSGITNNYFFDVDGTAISQLTNMSAGKTFSSNNITIKGNQMKGTGITGVYQNGIVIYKGSSYQIINNNITDVVYQGIQVLDITSTNFLISENIISNTSQTGISLLGLNHNVNNNIITDVSSSTGWNWINLSATCTYCNISGNVLLNSAAAVGLAINEAIGGNFNIISNNIINGTFTSPSITTTGGNTIVRQNIGFITENSGASTGTGVQQTVAHRLAITPTRQKIALISGSSTANPYHSAAPDATNIYVTAALNQPWYWATVGT